MPVNAFPKFPLLFVMNDKKCAALQKYGAFNPLTGITGEYPYSLCAFSFSDFIKQNLGYGLNS